MKLILLSDLHLIDYESLRFRDLFTKRSLALLNLKTRRRNVHSVEIVRKAIRKVQQLRPDHVLLTGDFSNMALRSEFELAKHVLSPIWDPKRLSVVPGNHDYYVTDSVNKRLFESYFHELIWGHSGANTYPGVKTIGPDTMLLLFKSAAYMPGPFSFGYIDEAQLQRAQQAIRAIKPKVILAAFHHNLHKRGLFVELTGRMLFRQRLIGRLMELGVTMVLTGHDHHHREFTIRNDKGTLSVICSGSSSFSPAFGQASSDASFTVLDIGDNPQSIKSTLYRYQNGDFHVCGD